MSMWEMTISILSSPIYIDMVDYHIHIPYPILMIYIPYRYSDRYPINVQSPRSISISISYVDIGSFLVTLAGGRGEDGGTKLASSSRALWTLFSKVYDCLTSYYVSRVSDLSP